MDIFAIVVGLLGGLALFLYGMQMMSNGLEKAAGDKMKLILEKLTSNRFLGVAVGAGITAVIQSSSATTVMVVGFVNTGLMTLRQAVWIIMGANIGTTITGQLISLDVDNIAKIVAFLGVAAIMFLKKERVKNVGSIMAGFGTLFIGMELMGNAMSPIKENPGVFADIMVKFGENPLLGILVGAIFTAVIQSSSASIGILQALAMQGLVPFTSAVFILFGQNIGTCITAVLASIGTTKNAKRTTVIHLLFNLIGTTIFTVVFLLIPSIGNFVQNITPGNVTAQIANMHTLFNIATSILLIPFGGFLATLAEKILPDKDGDSGMSGIAVLNAEYKRSNLMLGYSAVHIDILGKEIERMITMAKKNVERCFDAVINVDRKIYERAKETEEEIDVLNKEISQYISKTLVYNKTGEGVATTEQYFLITGNAERIGDHALNIGGYLKTIEKKNIKFSNTAKTEMGKMKEVTSKALEIVLAREGDPTVWLSDVAALEQKIDDMTKEYRENHLQRMRDGKCTEEGCVLYSELLTDFERIGDHALNIAQAYAKMK